MEPEPAPPNCPACGSTRVGWICYGMLLGGMIDAIKAEKIFHPRVDLTEDSPEWHCFACLHDWGTAGLALVLRERRLKYSSSDS